MFKKLVVIITVVLWKELFLISIKILFDLFEFWIGINNCPGWLKSEPECRYGLIEIDQW